MSDTDRIIAVPALRWFRVGTLVALVVHWVYHTHGPDAAASRAPCREAGTRIYAKIRRGMFVGLLLLLCSWALVNLCLSDAGVLIVGVVEVSLTLGWVAAFTVLMLTRWGRWFADQMHRWRSFRSRLKGFQRPLVIANALAVIVFLVVVLTALASTETDGGVGP